jgi:hypothetical protein
MLQLTHIPGPGVAAHRKLGIAGQAQAAQAQAAAVEFQKTAGQQHTSSPRSRGGTCRG